MVSATTLLAYSTIVLGLFLIPGPAVLLIIARATTGGHRVGLATGLGISVGDLVHACLTSFGLSAVLMTSALAFNLVKFAGAAYLCFLGLRALLERNTDIHLLPPKTTQASRAFRQGVLTELLNPKTALFFLAFLPQFVSPRRGEAFGQFAELGLVFVGMSIVYVSLLAFAAGHVGNWLARHKGLGRLQGRIIGTIYIALGIRLAIQQR